MLLSSPSIGLVLEIAHISPFSFLRNITAIMLRGMDPTVGFSKQRSADYQDFTANVLGCRIRRGPVPFHGRHQCPVQGAATIGNVPVIDTVLEWILRTGITGMLLRREPGLTTDILLLVPPKDYTAITDHLDSNFPRSTYPGVRISLKKHTDGEKDEEAAALSSDRLIARDGTARILRRMRQ